MSIVEAASRLGWSTFWTRNRVLALTIVVVAGIAAYDHALWSMVDLQVYEHGAAELLTGGGLYATGPGLPFTYPPFAAWVFSPLVMLGPVCSIACMIVVSLLCYACFSWVCARQLGLESSRWLILALLGLIFEPVLHTIGLGQVNLVLAAMIVVDCLVLPPKYRGYLLGIAVGIKLTPAVFVLYFLLRRDFAAIRRCAVSLLATVLLGWVVDPADSVLFWGKLFYNPGHVGRVGYPYNQGIYGMLARLGDTAHPSMLFFAGLVVLTLAFTVVAARRQVRGGHDLAALLCVAVCGLLLSPISWTHHWVWLVPATWVLALNRRWGGAALLAGVAIVEPLRYVPTPKFLPHLHDTWWQSLVSLSYTAAGACFLGLMLTVGPVSRELGKHQAGRAPLHERPARYGYTASSYASCR
ncbi:MAG: glycosyltransferase 87 family protein [Nocardioidaceae bacterium]